MNRQASHVVFCDTFHVTLAAAAPLVCVLFCLLWLGLVLFCFVDQGSSCRLLFDLEFAGT